MSFNDRGFHDSGLSSSRCTQARGYSSGRYCPHFEPLEESYYSQGKVHTASDEGRLVVGGIALLGLIAVPASYASLWIAAASLELAGAMASFTVATSVAAAPHLVAGGAAYATLQGGKAAARRGKPMVIAVAKDAQQRAKDIQDLVAVMRREQMAGPRRPGAAVAAPGPSDVVPETQSQAPWPRLPSLVPSFLSRPSNSTEVGPQVMSFEEAVEHQQEQQRNGTADAFHYYGIQLQDEEGEDDLSNPWLRIDMVDNDLPIAGEGNDG